MMMARNLHVILWHLTSLPIGRARSRSHEAHLANTGGGRASGTVGCLSLAAQKLKRVILQDHKPCMNVPAALDT